MTQGLMLEPSTVHSCTVKEAKRTCGRPSEFDVQVETPKGTRTVARSFNDFQQLQKSLGIPEENLPEFPQRQSIMTLVSAAARSERMQGLELFLAGVLKHFSNKVTDSPELAEFLGHGKSVALLSNMTAAELEQYVQQTDSAVIEEAVVQEPAKRPFHMLPSVGTWMMHRDVESSDSDSGDDDQEPEAPRMVDQPMRRLSNVGGVGGWTWLANVGAAGVLSEGENRTA
mmetsp:Transcript_115016/g.199507  ORF Transcript_115016/g.199507 Transcript_115016/m.199507 type:complete len:228 (-) Transcript_115016:102-785(-)